MCCRDSAGRPILIVMLQIWFTIMGKHFLTWS